LKIELWSFIVASRYRISPAVIIVCLFLHSAFAQGAGAPEYPIFRQELAPYVNARTVVEFSRDELLQHYPELEKKLEFAKDQEMLGPLLQRLGERVADFFRTFQDTSTSFR
jgi:hypothetical protein